MLQPFFVGPHKTKTLAYCHRFACAHRLALFVAHDESVAGQFSTQKVRCRPGPHTVNGRLKLVSKRGVDVVSPLQSRTLRLSARKKERQWLDTGFVKQGCSLQIDLEPVDERPALLGDSSARARYGRAISAIKIRCRQICDVAVFLGACRKHSVRHTAD